MLTWTGGREHGQRWLPLAVPLVPTHKLLLTLQDAEIRSYGCIENIVHPCGKEGTLSFSSPNGTPASLQTLGPDSTGTPELCAPLSPPLHHKLHKPKTVPYLFLQTINTDHFS